MKLGRPKEQGWNDVGLEEGRLRKSGEKTEGKEIKKRDLLGPVIHSVGILTFRDTLIPITSDPHYTIVREKALFSTFDK